MISYGVERVAHVDWILVVPLQLVKRQQLQAARAGGGPRGVE